MRGWSGRGRAMVSGPPMLLKDRRGSI
ncbi:unnamed protein product [Tuber melanosporum]|uniref:(Perigord truffle) hypothetical protein n=1 Tax=Tuber melanosporum (strain Mel28) TaxID=656061 RepID=D5GQ69_TUBMM|nr:unnamed protein product [Tuber melanosporum]